VAAEGGKLDVEVLTADPARINVQIEVPTWLVTMWDIGYRARGYDGTFARWIVELLTLHFVRCRGVSLGIIARTSATEWNICCLDAERESWQHRTAWGGGGWHHFGTICWCGARGTLGHPGLTWAH
jgi:hypothetical protein